MQLQDLCRAPALDLLLCVKQATQSERPVPSSRRRRQVFYHFREPYKEGPDLSIMIDATASLSHTFHYCRTCSQFEKSLTATTVGSSHCL